VSPITGTVRQVRPLASNPIHSSSHGTAAGTGDAPAPTGPDAVLTAPADDVPRGYEITIESAAASSPTTLELPAPRGRRLDTWFVALRQVGAWTDRDGGVGFIAQ